MKLNLKGITAEELTQRFNIGTKYYFELFDKGAGVAKLCAAKDYIDLIVIELKSREGGIQLLEIVKKKLGRIISS